MTDLALWLTITGLKKNTMCPMTHLVLKAIHAEKSLNSETACRQRWDGRSAHKLVQIDNVLFKILLVDSDHILQGAGLFGWRAWGRGVFRRFVRLLLDGINGVVSGRQGLVLGSSLGCFHLGFGFSRGCHVAGMLRRRVCWRSRICVPIRTIQWPQNTRQDAGEQGTNTDSDGQSGQSLVAEMMMDQSVNECEEYYTYATMVCDRNKAARVSPPKKRIHSLAANTPCGSGTKMAVE